MSVAILEDTIAEGEENFVVSLSGDRVSSGSSVATVTILDNDAVGVEIVFDPTDYRVSEEAGSVTLTVSVLSGTIEDGVNVEVTVTTGDGSANSGEDYAELTQTLTFTTDVTELPVSVAILEDTIAEGEENFVVSLSGDRVSSGSSVATVTILDNDAVGVEIVFDPTDYRVSEEAGSVTLTVSVLSGTIEDGVNVEVTVTTGDGSAVAGEDYTELTQTLTFTTDVTELPVSVAILEDTIAEGEENFVVSLSGDRVSSGSSVATVTILDNDAVGVEIVFDPTDYRVSEEVGSVTLTVSVLSGTIEDGVNVEVTVMTGDGSAVAGEDYAELTQTLTFTTDVTELPVSVAILEDTIAEGEENFVVSLSGDRVSSGSSVATVTILDNDAVGVEIVFDPTDYRVSEEAGSVTLTVSVLSGTIEDGVNVEVTVTTGDGSAVAGEDYAELTQTLTFTTDVTELPVSVAILEDTIAEGEENFVVSLSGDRVSSGSSVATVTILDNDAVGVEIVFDPTDYRVSEEVGSVTLTVSVLSGTIEDGVNVEVTVTTGDGSAVAGEDYAELTQTLTFTTDVTELPVSVAILEDTIAEGEENFVVSLSGDRVSSGSSVATVTILDNDAVGVEIVFDPTDYRVSEEVGSVTLTVSVLSGTIEDGVNVEVTVTTGDGSANSGEDYAELTQTLTFTTDVTELPVSVAILEDTIAEGEENFVVSLSGDRVSSGSSVATVTILDNDAVGVEIVFDPTDYRVSEEVGSVTLTVSVLSGTIEDGVNVEVTVTTGDGSANSGEDYAELTQTLTFTTDVTELPVSVAILEDTIAEGEENFVVSLSGDRVSSGSSVATVTILDNDAVEIVFDPTDYRVSEEAGSVTLTVSVLSGTIEDGVNVEVTVTTGDGSAVAGEDYAELTQTLTFTTDVTELPVSVAILEDTIAEGEENFVVSLSGDRVSSGSSVATVTILDNDAVGVEIVFDPTDYRVSEEVGSVTLTVSVLSGTIEDGVNVEVTVTTGDGSAVAGEDYAELTQTLTFTTDVTELPVSVAILEDTIAEGEENFVVSLSGDRVSSGSSVATVTILDNDAVEIVFDPTDYRVSEEVGSVTLTVSVLSGTIEDGVNVEVTVTTGDGSAVAGEDYAELTQTLTFTTDVTELPVSVAILEDTIAEGEENFVVSLSGDRVSSGSSVATVTILDNDAVGVEIVFDPTDYRVSEEVGSVTLTVSVLSGTIEDGVNVEVTVTTGDGSAVAGEDYTELTQTLTFTTDVTELPVSVAILEDTIAEGEENFVVSLSGDRVSSGSSVATVTILDNDAVGVEIVFDPTDYRVSEEAGSVTLTVSVLSGTIEDGVNVEVTVMTGDGSAVAGEDYAELTQTLTFTTDVTELPVSVAILEDTIAEGEENFVVSLSGDRVSSGSSVATVTILDNDAVGVEIVFDPTDYRVSEEAGSVTLTVSVLSGTIEDGVNVEVTVTTGDGSAVAGEDYAELTQTLTFTTDVTELPVSVAILEDTIAEGEENFVVSLSGDRVSSGSSVATVTILDNDAVGVEIVFDPTDYRVSEEAGSVTLTVSVLSGTIEDGVNVEVTVTTGDGSAVAGEDYTELTQTLTFTTDVTELPVSVAILEDTIAEGEENFVVSLSGDRVSSGSSVATVTILDNDAVGVEIVFDPTDYRVSEEVGSVTLTVSVLSGTIEDGVNVEVTVTTGDGSAVAGEDYAELTQTLTFTTDVTELPVSVAILEDTIAEGEENFVVSLSGDRVSSGSSVATVTILDNDAVGVEIVFDPTDYRVSEEVGSVTLTVSVLSGTIEDGVNVEVTVTTGDGSAVAGEDYAELTQTLTFTTDVTELPVSVAILEDTIAEGEENFVVSLSGDRVSSGSSVATVTILDNDAVGVEIVFDPTDYRVSEEVGSVTLTVSVLSGTIEDGVNVEVTVTTGDGSANSGEDYAELTQTLTFTTDVTELPVSVAILEDTIAEGEENFVVSLSGDRVSSGSSVATVTILDNDAVEIVFDPTDYRVSEEAGSVTLTVSVLSGTIEDGVNVEVTVTTGDGSAVAGEDYAELTQTLTFTTDVTELPVSVAILEDTIAEGEENFVVSLSGDRVSSGSSVATVTILDNDAVGVEIVFDPTDYRVSEEVGSVTLTVSVLSGTIEDGVNVEVTVTTGDGSAVAGEDYAELTQTLTFTTDVTELPVSVAILEDTIAEGEENFVVSLSGDRVSSGSSVATVTILDNDAVEIVFDPTDYRVSEEAGSVTLTVSVLSGTIEDGVNVEVTVTTGDGSAVAGEDYAELTQTLTFTTDVTELPVSVAILEDTIAEGEENFVVSLSGDRVSSGSSVATVTILDNDAVGVEIVFDPTDYRVSEEVGSVTLTVSVLSGTIEDGVNVEVTVTTSDGSAVAGEDYTELTQTLTFTTDVTELPVSVAILEDTIAEGEENFVVSLSGDRVSSGSSVATVTILDNDAVGVEIVFDPTDYRVSEEAGSVTLTVSVLSGTIEDGVNVEVTVTTGDGSAVAGEDYAELTQTLTFTTDVTELPVSVAILEDTIAEGEENFVVSLSGDRVSSGSSVATVTILDNDAVGVEIVFDPTDYRVSEEVGSVTLTVSVLSGTIEDGVNVEVTVTTGDGSANSGEDYAELTQTLTFTTDVTELPVSVAILEDTIAEGEENFVVSLSGDRVSSGSSVATVTILDNDAVGVEIVFDPTDYRVSEEAGSVTLTVSVLSGTIEDGVNVEVTVTTGDGSAVAGEDYAELTQTLTFTTDVTELPVSVAILEDTIAEGEENFVVSLSGDRVSSGSSVATVTILDNDAVGVEIVFDPTDYRVSEEVGSVTLTVSVLSGTIEDGVNVEVTVTTGDGSAVAGEDYAELTQTLTFTTDVTELPVSVAILEDTIAEGEENFVVSLSGDRVSSGSSVATVTILDNDAVEIVFDPTDYRVSEEAGSVTLTVSVLSGTIEDGVNVEVTVTTGDGSAVAGEDYTELTQTLTFTTDVTELPVSVAILEDTIAEGEENFVVSLSGDRVSSGSSVATVTILDNDAVEIVFDPTDYRVSEEVGSVTLTVSVLSGTIEDGVNVEVTVTTGDGSAVAGEDYAELTQTLTFTTDVTELPVSVAILEDTIAEGEENFVVSLSGDRVSSGSSVATVTILDNDAVGVEIVFDPTDYRVSEEAGSVTLTVSVLSGTIEDGVNVEVTVMTGDGSAVAGEDYAELTQTLTFTTDVTELPVSVAILEDTIAEGEENFVVSLSGDRVSSGSSVATVTILDNDAVEIVFDPTDYRVSEEVGSVTLTVSVLSGTIEDGVNVEVTVTTGDGSAVAGEDYAELTQTLTFTTDVTELPVSVAILEDTIAEGEENFVVSLSGDRVSSGSSVATVTILDNDAVGVEIVFDPTDYRVSEEAGSVTLTVSVLSGTIEDGVNVEVTVTTGDGSAVAGEDYAELTQTLTFTTDVTELPVSVAILEDTIAEGEENFVVSLSGDRVSSGSSVATVTILDNDAVGVEIVFDPTDYRVSEEAGSVTLTVSVLSGTIEDGVNVEVTVTTGDGSAVAGEDYTELTQTLTFTTDVTELPVSVAILEDTIAEGEENFVVSLSGDRVSSGSSVATVTILDNDAVGVEIVFDPTDYRVSEEVGSVTLTVSVLSGTIEDGVNVEVTVTTSDGSAVAGEDYTELTQTLTFTTDVTELPVSVAILEDTIAEGEENFVVSLSGDRVSSGSSVATVTILDNDAVGVEIVFDPTDYRVSEEVGSVTLTVSVLSGTIEDGVNVEVTVTTGDGSAVAGEDYAELTQTLTFTTDVTELPVSVAILEDTIAEGEENFVVSLSGDRVSSGSSVATVTILDNDAVSVAIGFSPAVYSVDEDAGSVELTVVVSSGEIEEGSSVTLSVRTIDGSAVAPGDYDELTQTLVFSSSVTEATVTVVIANDPFAEGDEEFRVTLSGDNVSSGSNVATVTIEANDEVPSVDPVEIGFDPTVYRVLEGAGSVTLTVSVLVGTIEVGDSVTLSVMTIDGSAVAPGDYNELTQTLVFSSSVTEATVTVVIANDPFAEDDEEFRVTLSGDLVSSASSVATVTIRANDEVPSVDPVEIGFDPTDYRVSESAGIVTLTVSVLAGSIGAGDTVTVSVMTLNGSAFAPGDYTAFTGTLTFSSNVTEATVTVVINNDALVEGFEVFTVHLTTSQENMIPSTSTSNVMLSASTASVTITDEAVLSVVGPDSDEVEESATGMNVATFTVSLPDGVTAVEDITLSWSVDCTTGVIGAASAADFAGGTCPSDSATILSGATSTNFSITIADDDRPEGTESFTVSIVTMTAGDFDVTFDDGSDEFAAGVSLLDDESVTVSVTSSVSLVREGESFTFRLVLEGGVYEEELILPWRVDFGSDSASASASDFAPDQALSGMVTIPANSRTSAPVTLDVASDGVVEGDEIFRVIVPIAGRPVSVDFVIESMDFSSDDVTIDDIDDDDPDRVLMISITAASVTVIEGSVAVFTVELTGGVTDDDLSVVWSVDCGGGSDVTSGDFVGGCPSGTVTIASGETSATFAVYTNDDSVVERVETFTVTLLTVSPNIGGLITISADSGMASVDIRDTDTGNVVVSFDRGFRSVSGGSAHTCGIREDGSVECWGSPDQGQTTLRTPDGTELADVRFRALSAKTSYTCGIVDGGDDDGKVRCWGSISSTSELPTELVNVRFRAVNAGGAHACGIRDGGDDDGKVACWGANTAGQIGLVTPVPDLTPLANVRFRALSLGEYYSCGIVDGDFIIGDEVIRDGEVECWGTDFAGQSSPPQGVRFPRIELRRKSHVRHNRRR